MGTNDGAVDEQTFQVWVMGKVPVHLGSDTTLTPAGEPFVDRVPGAVRRRQKPPLGATAADPQHAFQESATLGLLADVDAWHLAQKIA